jgi:hypothetical protein
MKKKIIMSYYIKKKLEKLTAIGLNRMFTKKEKKFCEDICKKYGREVYNKVIDKTLDEYYGIY